MFIDVGITRRYTAQGYSDYAYEDGTDWLVRETWHAASSLNVFDPSTGLRAILVRYWTTNGRPSRMEVASTSGDLQYLYSYSTLYLQCNWHGGVSALVDVNGNGDGWNNVSPFGDNGNGAYPADPNLEQYYCSGGASGYRQIIKSFLKLRRTGRSTSCPIWIIISRSQMPLTPNG